MILEFEDITERRAEYKNAFGHVHLPSGMTLGGMFDKDTHVASLKEYVLKCSINDVAIENWQDIVPIKNDRVKIVFRPGFEAIIALLGTTAFTVGTTAVTYGMLISAISAVFSVISFFIQLFSSPPTLPSISGGSRPKYSFEGLKTSIAPGNPVDVIYGQERTGGQILALNITPFKNPKGVLRKQQMSMLVGVGEGPIAEVNCFRVNDIDLTTIGGSASAEFRLGNTSQSIITDFETIKDTFADGREITGVVGGITYTTNGDSLVEVQLQITAAEGLIHRDTDGTENSNWDEYSVESRPTGTTTFSFLDNRKRFTAKTAAPIWQIFASSLSPPDGYDIRIDFLRGAHAGNDVPGAIKARGRLWLSNVTEIQGAGEPYSSTALVAFKAIATTQFHGGPPQLSILTRGRTVKVFSTTTVNTIIWSQNPSWCLLDYMTNSVYGMGAYMSESDMDMQSFLDFAVLSNSKVPNGNGGLEDQHHLDLIMNTKRAHWEWVHNILGLYRSGIIQSQQKWKIITDRQDLPVRQIFHSGNIIPQVPEIKMGGDPMRPNQANVAFTNQELDYEQDFLYVQDSASVFGAKDPIKDYDLALYGITRRSEAVHNASFDLNRRRQIRRETSFATGLEAIAVEPGDHCRVGIAMTDWEAGFGGRALDGSSRHIILDRDLIVKSGFTYDMHVWHIAADTPEQRTVATTVPAGITEFSTAVISPTSGFAFQVMPNDRYAIGITSEDLMLATVKRTTRDELGRHRIIAEEYRTVVPTTPQPRQLPQAAPATNHPPAQPMGVVITEGRPEFRDGTIASMLIVDVSPAPPVEGGRITVPGTTASVTLATSHNPNSGALVGEELYFTSGAASGGTYLITAWGGAGTRVATVTPTFAAVPTSGNPYNLNKLKGEYAGFDLMLMRNFPTSESEMGFSGSYLGARAEIPMTPQAGESTNLATEVIPFSTEGVRNYTGTWQHSFTTFGDTVPPPMPGSLYITRVPVGAPTIQVIPTSYGDLWGHLFYRHTANCFTNATSIGFGTTNFQDAGVSYATTYYYWAAPIDFSLNVGSWIGPITHVHSFIITTDIDSNAVTNLVTFNRQAITNFSTSGTAVQTIGFATITTRGGPIMIISNASILAIEDRNLATVIIGLNVGSARANPSQCDMVYGHNFNTGQNLQKTPFAGTFVDPQPAGTYTYYISCNYATPVSNNSYTTSDVNLQLLELKR